MLLVWLLFLSLILHLTGVHATSCASATDCFKCTALPGCHFCSFDRQCHAIGSPYGCLVGDDCEHFEKDCFRHEPESLELPPPPRKAIIGIVLTTVGLLSLNAVLGFCCRACCGKVCCGKVCCGKSTSSDGQQTVPLTQDPITSSEVKSPQTPEEVTSTQPTQSDQSIQVAQPNSPEEFFSPIEPTSPRATAFYISLPEAYPPKQDVRMFRLRRACALQCRKFWTDPMKVVILIGSILILIGMTIALLYYPREPEYSVCAEHIDWESILSGIIHGKLEANIDMHMSFANPNLIGIDVKDLNTSFLYRKTEVGRGRLQNVTLLEKSITDFVFPTKFNPSLSSAISMLTDHERGSLLMDVVANFDTGVRLLGRRMFSVKASYAADKIDVEIDDPRKYCLCKSFHLFG